MYKRAIAAARKDRLQPTCQGTTPQQLGELKEVRALGAEHGARSHAGHCVHGLNERPGTTWQGMTWRVQRMSGA
eukprot:364263-Chlamydomonas_euryale.AAC.7